MPDPAISGVFAESRGSMLPATVAMRQRAMSDFLHACGWGGAVHMPLAGDASFRSYYRLSRGRDRAVLMDAPPPQEDIGPYVTVAAILRSLGFSAPRYWPKTAPKASC